jgi:hypothetical protein
MKRIWLSLSVIVAMAMGGCSSLNIAGTGTMGDTSAGVDVDALNKSVGVNAANTQTIKTGNTETSINTSTDGANTNVDTNVDVNNE